MQKKKIVVVGGGTGTHTVLTGLKKYKDEVDLTAIVAMTDSGGSTGRLRDEFGYLPVGDVRMALAALANEDGEHEALIRKLFLHRFTSDGDISGHNFGNLFLVALTDILGSEEEAITAASRVLRVCGQVIPVTKRKVDLIADYADGRHIVGEHEIDEPVGDVPIVRITRLGTTADATLNARARNALLQADVIVLGPGDLYTSVLANCVVDGFSETMKEAKGTMVYVANLMTKVGQTSGMGVRGHIEEIAKYSGRIPDVVIVNDAEFPEDMLLRYQADGEYPVLNDCEGMSIRLIREAMCSTNGIARKKGDVLKRSLIRHDPEKLAEVLMSLL